MKKLKLLAFVFVALSVIEFSCSKGTTGPQGPAGPAGTDSIIYSSWTQLNMSLISVDTLGDSTYGETLTASTLTSSILDQGAVLSYIAIPGGASNGTDTLVINISDVYTWSLGTYISQDLAPGTIDLYSNFDFSTDNGVNIYFRYVLIPGSILTTNSVLKNYTKAQLKAADYSVISKALGLTNKVPN